MNYFPPSTRTIRIPLTNVRLRQSIAVLCFGLIGSLLPMCYGWVRGIAVPHVQDEMSYTVAADTYAHFRVTNPTPKSFESFEAPHVLVEPSYISKYPPGQGIFMAIGQLVTGKPIYGVWLSCGLFAASLFWMLLAWTRPTWAIIGTLMAIALIGVDSYWAQSYWGGMVAAMGGSLFFGGLRRLFSKLSVGASLWMATGGIVLINSRPFEGTLTMLLPLAVLGLWLLRDKRDAFVKKLGKVIVPGAIIACLGLSAMAYQFYRVTGSPFTLPYAVHQAQYYPTPLFIFQSFNPSATRGNERIRRIYDVYTSPPILEEFLKPLGLPYSIYLRPIYGLVYLFIAIPWFFLSPLLMILLYASLALTLKRDRLLWLPFSAIVVTFAGMALGIWWDQYHYCAPLTCCFYLLAVEGMRQFYLSAKKGKERKIVISLLIFLVIASVTFQQLYAYYPNYLISDLTQDREKIRSGLQNNTLTVIEIPLGTQERRGTFFKPEFEKIVDGLPDRYAAIVSYDKIYNIHDEIVYNKADIENAKVIWAHDLGCEKNDRMLQDYSPRKALLVRLEGIHITIKPVAEGECPSWNGGQTPQ